jgi:hypothetical protein
MATYPIGPSSTIDPAPSRPTYPDCPAAERPVVFPIRPLYLGRGSGRDNAAPFTICGDWNRRMTTFDKREEGFEKKYALDEEQKFKA